MIRGARLIQGLPLADNAPGELTLTFSTPPPQMTGNGRAFIDENRAFYGVHARRMVAALLSHAPGGFVDALLGELLHEKSCVFRVTLKDDKAPGPVCGAKAVRHNTAYVCQLEPGHTAMGSLHDDGAGTTWLVDTTEIRR